MPANSNGNGENGFRRQLYFAVGFLILALAVSFLPTAPQALIAEALQDSVLRPFIATQSLVNRSRLRAEEASELRVRLDSLTSVVTNQESLAEENRRLRKLLRLTQRAGQSYLPASVIRYSRSGAESQFLVDVGADDGVLIGAPVLVSEGLVGQVRGARDRQAIGIDWTHPDFRASAMTEDGTVYGMVEPDRGAFREDDRLVLNGTPYHAELAEGTRIVTSGLGGVYPRGIPVGTVLELKETEAGWRKSYWVMPFVSPGSVTHVLVAVGPRIEAGADVSRLYDPASLDSFDVVDEFGLPPGLDTIPGSISTVQSGPGGGAGSGDGSARPGRP